MFVSFSVENFRSYKNKATIDFTKDKDKNVSKDNLGNKAIILGGNSSGKSNLFKAIFLSKNYVLEQKIDGNGGTLPLYAPYDSTKPMGFIYKFFDDSNNRLYEYEFKIDKKENTTENLEIAYERFRINDSTVYDIQTDNIVGDSEFIDERLTKTIKQFIDNGKPNILLLRHIAFILVNNSPEIIQFLIDEFSRIICCMDNALKNLVDTVNELEDRIYDEELITLLKTADESFSSIEKKGNGQITVRHSINNHPYEIPLWQESGGLQKLLQLYLHYCGTKFNHKYFFVDELDARMHYQLIIHFLTNISKNQQWAITSHNIGVLESSFDDHVFYTVTKNDIGESSIRNICEINYRKKEGISRLEYYIRGSYQGHPNFISEVL